MANPIPPQLPPLNAGSENGQRGLCFSYLCTGLPITLTGIAQPPPHFEKSVKHVPLLVNTV